MSTAPKSSFRQVRIQPSELTHFLNVMITGYGVLLYVGLWYFEPKSFLSFLLVFYPPTAVISWVVRSTVYDLPKVQHTDPPASDS